MVGNLKIRNHRITVTLHLHILAVVAANRNRRIDDIGNLHHNCLDSFLDLFFPLGQFIDALGIGGYPGLDLFGFLLLPFSH